MAFLPFKRYQDFVQRVRAHAPSELLPALARVSAANLEQRIRDRSPKGFAGGLPPWVTAAAARESIAWGDEHRSKPVTDNALRRSGQTFLELGDPWMDGQPGEGLSDFMVRLAYEQFPWNETLFTEMAHVVAVLDRDLSTETYEVLRPSVWEDLLGVSPVMLTGLSFLFGTGAQVKNGRMDLGWLSQPNFQDVVDSLPIDMAERSWPLFSATFQELRARARTGRSPNAELSRYDWNPLQATPFVGMPDGTWIAPEVAYVHRRCSLDTVYHLGYDRWGERFSRDFGLLVERYVGDQVGLLAAQNVLHDYEYERGQRAVDYVVVLEDLVLLVEVKSARVNVASRLGSRAFVEDVRRDVGKSFKQIAKSAELVADGRLPGVPHDRSVRGFVVTVETHHLVNASGFRDRLPDPKVPTAVLSLGEFEEAIAEGAAGPPGLWLALADTGTDDADSVRKVLYARRLAWGSTKPPRNAILDRAWESMPFRQGGTSDNSVRGQDADVAR